MIFSTLRRGLLALPLTVVLSGCLGSEEPINPQAKPVTFERLQAVIGAQALRERNLRPAADHRLARHGVLAGGEGDPPLYFRLLPAADGLVIEFLPGKLDSKVFAYGAILPGDDGGGFYFAPEIGGQLAQEQPEGSPFQPLQALVGPVTQQDGLWPTVAPRDLEAVITIYKAMRDHGLPSVTNILE